jgi:hypothetical protein
MSSTIPLANWLLLCSGTQVGIIDYLHNANSCDKYMQLTTTYQNFVQKKFQQIPPDVGLTIEFAKSPGDGQRDG